MSYLGNAPARSFISFERQVFTIVNSQTAYALSHSVANENDIRLVVNNVVQEPGSGKAYTATGTALTLSAALTNGTDEMYCVFLGRATATSAPGAGSIGTAQLASDSVTLAKMASGTDGNIISYDASGNPVAVATGNDGQVLTSAGAGAPPAFETPASAVNTPMFMAAYTGSGVTINDATDTKGTFSTEFIDIGGVYNTSTSRYTPGFVGKSFISTGMSFYNANAQIQFARVLFYKNGASLTNATDNPASDTGQIWISSQLIVDHDADDYFEVYLRSDTSNGSAIEVPATSGNSAKPFNYFQGHKLIT